MNQFTNPWSDATIEKLKAMRTAGLSASQMVADLARDGVSVTRNAVLGKINRMGLAPAMTRASSKPKRARKTRGMPINSYSYRSNLPQSMQTRAAAYSQIDEPLLAVDIDAPFVSANPVTWEQLQHHHCRAMVNGGTLYCGNARGKDWRGHPSSYCSGHHRLYFTKPSSASRQIEKMAGFYA